MKDMNRNLEIRPNSEGLTTKIRGKTLRATKMLMAS
jgi:hypothetical protein